MYYRNILTKIIEGDAYINLGKQYKFNNRYKENWLSDSLSDIHDEKFINLLLHKKLIKETAPSCKIIEKNIINKVHLQLTNFCMCNCGHCYVGTPDNKALSYQDTISLLDDFIQNGVTAIDYSGGEPTLHKQFSEIIAYGKKQGLRQMLFSNGYIKKKILPTIAKNIDTIQISIDGTESYHNEFRKNDKVYQKALNTLDYLKDTGIEILISMSVTPDNVVYIPHVVELAQKYSAKFRISPPVPVGRYSGKNNDYYVSLLSSIKRSCQQNNIELEELKPRKSTCDAIKKYIYVDVNQDIYPCPLLSTKDFLLGRYGEQELAKALESSTARAIYQRITSITDTDKKYVFFCPAYFFNMDCQYGFFGES